MEYVELHCHTNYSLLDGASTADALAARAKDLGMAALAVTDHDGLYGAVRFVRACRAAGIKPIVGAELTTSPSSRRTSPATPTSVGWSALPSYPTPRASRA
jgi:DNA polymerase III alpha subunit